jgi:hypothetical protein
MELEVKPPTASLTKRVESLSEGVSSASLLTFRVERVLSIVVLAPLRLVGEDFLRCRDVDELLLRAFLFLLVHVHVRMPLFRQCLVSLGVDSG